MNLKYFVSFAFSVIYVSQSFASTKVIFNCTDEIKQSNKGPIIEGLAQEPLKSANNSKGFGFSCFAQQESGLQEAQIPSGKYNVQCVFVHNNISKPENTFDLDEGETYYISFMEEPGEQCTAIVSRNTSVVSSLKTPEISEPLSQISSTQNPLTQDASIIKNYFMTASSEQRIDETKVNVRLIPNRGGNNLAMYQIKVSREPHNDSVYFAKLCLNKNEPEKYRELQNTVQQFNTLAESQKYPHFVKYAGMFDIDWPMHGGYFKNAFQQMGMEFSLKLISELEQDNLLLVKVLLTEAAKGESVRSLINNAYSKPLQEIHQIFKNIGLSIGNFMNYESRIDDFHQSPFDREPSKHIVGYVHRDLNSDNVFYDETTNKVSLIDYDSLTSKGTVDFEIGNLISNLIDNLEPLLKKSQNKEQAAKIKAIFDSYREGIESAFSSSPEKLAIVRYRMTFFKTISFFDLLRRYFSEPELPNFIQIEKDFHKAMGKNTNVSLL